MMGDPSRILEREPWLVPMAVEFLDGIIEEIWRSGKRPRVLETGAGGSTLFFSDRGCRVVTFEDSKDWVEIVKASIGEENEKKTKVIFDPFYSKRGIEDKIRDDYDIILIDGRGRQLGIKETMGKQVNGGWLIVDNAERNGYRNWIRKLNRIHREKIAFAVGVGKKKWMTQFWKVDKIQ